MDEAQEGGEGRREERQHQKIEHNSAMSFPVGRARGRHQRPIGAAARYGTDT